MDLSALEYLRNVPEWFWLVVSGIYGAIIGSFLNVCIYRIPRRVEVVRTASFCPHCNQKIQWYLNVPVFSWLILGGKTKCCQKPLTIRYPLVELTYAAIAVISYSQFGLSWELLQSLFFGGALLVLIFIDWEHMRLPDVITLPGAVIGYIFVAFGISPSWLSALSGSAFGAITFLVIAFVYEKVRGMEGLGMGDVKLMLMVGAFLGMPLTLFVIVLGSLSALMYGVILMRMTSSDMTLKIPFGSFLGGASLILFLWGQPMAEWYLSLFGR